jgi:hypothetical protein
MTSSTVTISRSESMPWINGLEVLETMAPQFAANIGERDVVEREYQRYWQKNLFWDPETTRRIDLVRIDAGYHDPSACFHDCVEEIMILTGDLVIHGEGPLSAGDYFWRPPGWIHVSESENGYTGIICFQGEGPESGRMTRTIAPAEQAGTNARFAPTSPEALSGRGWVKRLETQYAVWQPGTLFAQTEGELTGFDIDHIEVKVLSKNPELGRQTLLVRLAPGYAQSGPGTHSTDLFGLVLEGSCELGTESLAQGDLMYRPAGAVAGPLSSETGATLFVKIDGWLDFAEAP